jgi:Mce-associated membrane protein
VPPRTRAITTAPAGRRPKVAGLRGPRRDGSSGDDGRPEPLDSDVVDDGAADEGAVDDGAVTEPAAEESAAEDPEPTGTATRAAAPAPSSKARRAQRAGGSAGSGTGTALLDRPDTRSRPVREEKQPAAPGSPARRRAAGLVAPVRRLGANRRALVGVLAAVTVVCLVLAGLAFWQGRQAWTTGPVSNQAVVDVGGTAEVVGQSRQAIEQILSYDFTKLDDSVNAAKSQSTGAFTSQYLSVFEQTIRGPATDQKLRQTASVLNIGVKQLDGDHASLMALVQFTAERTTNQQTTNAPGLLNVDVVRQDGRWKISAINPM